MKPRTKTEAHIRDLLAATGDSDVKEALEAYQAGDLLTAFDSLDAAAETLASREDDDNAETAEWLRETVDEEMP